MKKLIILILIFSLIFSSAAMALESVGPLTSSDAGRGWMNVSSAEARVSKVLKGNIGFAANTDNVWVRDGKQKMDKKTYIDEKYVLYIPVSAANSIFGLKLTGEYITADNLKKATGLSMYYDPFGLAVFGSSVPTKVKWNTVCDTMGEILWTDVDLTDEEIEFLIRRWQGLLGIPEGKEDMYSAYSKSTITSAKKLQAQLSYVGENEGPFADLPNLWKQTDINAKSHLSALGTLYDRLETMAKGYLCGGKKDEKLRDDILKAIEFSHEKFYSKKQSLISSSWTVELMEVPYAFANTLCIMYDDIPKEQRLKYTNAMFDRHPDPSMRRGSDLAETYTNRSWRCYSYFNLALVANDVERMNYAMKCIAQALMYTPVGFDERGYDADGFYSDGSMIFHKGYAYNSAYGVNYLLAHSVQTLLTENTRMDVRNLAGWEVLLDAIPRHLLPFVEENNFMRMTKGRQAPGGAGGLIQHAAIVMVSSPEPHKTHIAKEIKAATGDYWEKVYANSNGVLSDYKTVSGPSLTERFREAVEFINSIEVNNQKELKSTVYYNMDRVVHRAEKFTAGLAMSSRRIFKLESFGVGANSTGWYTGDGMLYIYDGTGQHNASYTSSANPYHIPGTTVDSTPRDPAFSTADAVNWGYPDNLWAGATTNGKTTMCTYEIGNKYVSSLKGKKSYFLLGDKVVCMGSGISAGNGNVYTTVENYLIKKGGQIKALSDIKIPIQTMRNSQKPDVVYTNSYSANSGTWGDWYLYDLGEVREGSGIMLTFANGAKRRDLFSVEVSKDGVNYELIYDGGGNGKSLKPQYFHCPFEARYIKINCYGNNASKWFSYSDIAVIEKGYDEAYINELTVSIVTGFEDVFIDGQLQEVEFNKEKVFENPKYAYIENGSGFVFLDADSLSFNRETYENSTLPFASMWINHGNIPKNETYAYVLLPKSSKEEVEAFYENPTVEILENTPSLHIVRDKETGIWGASVFVAGKCMDINVKTPCTILGDTKNKTLYVSDPTHRFKEITLIMPSGIKVKAQKGIKVNGQKVTIDISAEKGKTYSFTYFDK